MEALIATARQRLDAGRLRFGCEASLACLALGPERSLVLAGEDTSTEGFALALGSDRTAREHLRDEPPTARQLEWAIRVVEDEVIGARALLPTAVTLLVCSPGADTAARLGRAGRQPGHLDLTEVEALYQALARASQRRAYTSESPFRDVATWGAVLILREFMHHLGYREAWLSP